MRRRPSLRILPHGLNAWPLVIALLALFLPASFPVVSFAQSPSQSAERHYQKGVALLEAKKYDEAIAAFAAALKLAPKHEGAYAKRIEAYQQKMTIFGDGGQHREALQIGENLLANVIRQNDSAALSKIYYRIGHVQYRMGNYPLVSEAFSKSLKNAQKSGLRSEQAGALNGLGLAAKHVGELDRAMNYFQQALALYHELSDTVGEGIVLGNLANLLLEEQNFDQASVYLEQALALHRKTDGRRYEANTLGEMAALQAYLGNFPKSLELDSAALKIYQAISYPSGIAQQLGNLGTTYLQLGDYRRGLQCLKQAASLSKKLDDKYHWQNQLGNIGHAYYFLGDFDQAYEAFQQAQQIAHDIKEVSDEAAWLGALGQIHFERRENRAAIQSFVKAIASFKKLEDRRGQAIFTANLATAYNFENNFTEAFTYYDSALQLHQEIENPYGVGETYNGLGALHLKEGDAVKSRAAHEQALTLGKRLQAQKIIWEAQYGLAQAAQREGKLTEAKKTYLEAIATVEAVRARLASTEQKAYFLSSRDEIYKGLIQTLHRMHQQRPDAGYDLEAFYYSEKAKARASLDLLAEAKVQPDLPTSLQTQQNAALQKIAGLQTQLQQAAPSDSMRAALLLELEQAEEALQDVIIEIKQKNPAYAQLEYPEAVQLPDFRRRILDDNELVLTYALGEESSYLWAITAKQHLFLPLPPTTIIEKAVKSYIALIDTVTRISVPHQARGRELFDLLLKPAGDLVAHAQKIIIIADGVLHNLPFEAVIALNANDKPKYLIEHAEIVYAPSATVLSFLHANQRMRPSRHPRTLLAFADPIFEAHEVLKNENGARGVGDSLAADSLAETSLLRGWYEHLGIKFRRLPFTAAEMDSIAQFFPSSAKRVYRREEALEERLKREDLKRYAFVHFATHGVLDERHPGRSSLVLTLDDEPSEDGFVQINEILNFKLEAEIVVLSACATATGKCLPGEGLCSACRARFCTPAPSPCSAACGA